MREILLTAGMLDCSNIFMTFARYGHLKNFNSKPWIVAAFKDKSLILIQGDKT